MKYISNIIRMGYFAKYLVVPWRFPLVYAHTMKRLQSTFKNHKGFRIIDLALTYDCNLNCQHCSALVMKRAAPTLTLDDYKDIVRQAEELDLLSWNITGGEPLIVEWLDDLIPVLKPRTHYISIQTNCMILDEKMALKLAKLGVNCITTSLDSIVAEEHNEFRGSPLSYEKVFEGIRNAKKAGMQVLIGGTVTHQNLRSHELVEMIKKANEVGAIFLFNLAVPCGKWEGQNNMVLRGDDRQYLNNLLEKFPKTSTDHEVGRNAIGCPAGVEKVYITPYGDVIPCPFIHISFGNILASSLKEIVCRMQKVPEFSTYPKICVAAEDITFHREVLSKISSLDEQRPVPYQNIYEDLSE